jgi:Carboxypeptidase regulatory-like domain/Bacterial Ig-like domain
LKYGRLFMSIMGVIGVILRFLILLCIHLAIGVWIDFPANRFYLTLSIKFRGTHSHMFGYFPSNHSNRSNTIFHCLAASIVIMVMLSGCGGSDGGVLKGKFVLEDTDNSEGIFISLLGTNYSATTDENGNFFIDRIPPGSYSLLVSLEGYQTYRKKSVKISKRKTLKLTTITLKVEEGETYPVGEVAGSVLLVDSEHGGGAFVSLMGTPFITATRPDGSFTIADVPEGDYDLIATKSGYIWSEPMTVAVLEGNTTRLSEIILKPKHTEQERGFMEGLVYLQNEQDHSGTIIAVQTTSLMTFSRPDGSFAIADIPSGTHSVRFSRAGFQSRTFDVFIDATGVALEAINLKPSKTAESLKAAIKGRVVLAGELLHNNTIVHIEGTSLQVSTKSNGEYSFYGLETGTYNLLFTHEGFADKTLFSIRLDEGETRELRPQVLLPMETTELTATLYGTALLQHREQHAGITIELSGTQHPVAITNSEGRYTFTGIEPGKYSIQASFPGFEPASSEEIELASGDLKEAPELLLELVKDYARVLRTTPTKGARRVEVSDETLVIIEFDRQMDSRSVENAINIQPAVAYAFSYGKQGSSRRSDTLEVHLLRYEDPPVTFKKLYRITVGTGAMDLDGNTLEKPYEFSFTTGGPRILGHTPGDGSTIVTGRLAPLSFEVNEALDMKTLSNRAVTIRPRPSSKMVFSHQPTRRGAMIRIDAQLKEATRYTVTIAPRVLTKSGQRLDNTPYRWSFRTVRFDDLPGFIGDDNRIDVK